MKLTTKFFCAVLCLLAIDLSPVTGQDVTGQDVPAALNFTMKSIEGEDVSLSKYAGKVVVFVNVASKCGYTSQYEQLQALHEDYAEKGVAIIGVPCNQFGGQEPGTEAEVAKFCEENYGVEFELMSKVDVNGDSQTPLYKYLTNLELAPKAKGAVSWNFEKFILDRTGKPVARFGSKVSPDSDEFMAIIKKALETEAPAAANPVKPFSYVSEKSGKTYYLFCKRVPLKNSDKTQTIYFFAKDRISEKGEPVAEVPADRVVSETKTGLPVLKSKQAKEDKDAEGGKKDDDSN